MRKNPRFSPLTGPDPYYSFVRRSYEAKIEMIYAINLIINQMRGVTSKNYQKVALQIDINVAPLT